MHRRARLATLSGLYGYFGARNLVTTNPVPPGSAYNDASKRSVCD
nr:hypothetical protein [Rhodococcus sp. (in: high G+C Gram-positive bacteria)]